MELISNKTELHTGMRVKLRNKQERVVMLNVDESSILSSINSDDMEMLGHYDYNMLMYDRKYKAYDIMEVYFIQPYQHMLMKKPSVPILIFKRKK